MKFWEQIRRSMAITKKDLSIYYMRGPVVISGLLVPSFLFITFVVGRGLAFTALVPALIGMALFFTVSSIGPVIAPWETKMKTFERLISAPISLWAIILGDIIASFLFGLFVTFIILIVVVCIMGLGIISFNLILGTIIAAFCFSSLGLIISAPPTDNPSNIMMLASIIKYPMIFISGVFVSLAEMGSFKIISFFSPLTYFIDLVRYSVDGTNYFSPGFDLLVLSGFSVVFFFIAIKWHKKSLAKRF